MAGTEPVTIVGPVEHLVQDVTGWPEAAKQAAKEALAKVAAAVAAGTPAAAALKTWNQETWEKARLLLLADGAQDQVAVIEFARQHGGAVTRDQVYELCGFSKTRSLRGFTRATNRVAGQLQADGQLKAHTPPLLRPRYGDPKFPAGHAAGFAIPAQLVVS